MIRGMIAIMTMTATTAFTSVTITTATRTGGTSLVSTAMSMAKRPAGVVAMCLRDRPGKSAAILKESITGRSAIAMSAIIIESLFTMTAIATGAAIQTACRYTPQLYLLPGRNLLQEIPRRSQAQEWELTRAAALL